jgi:CRP/FNR family transcriptional regulator, cyclic AMP receptor protein
MNSARILETVEIFMDLSPSQLTKIYDICTEIHCTKGTNIVKENTLSTEIYVILDGEVELLVEQRNEGESTEKRVGTFGRGQSFGEIALVDQGLRSATVRCLSETCRLLEISRKDLLALLKENSEIGYQVMYNLAADLCLKFRQAANRT